MRPPAAAASPSPSASSPLVRALIVIAGLAAALTSTPARAEADDDPDAASPDPLEEIYRRVALPPFFERRIQSILQEEWDEVRENAQKVGLRRMSRRHFRRSLVALDRRTDGRIRTLIGAKKFAAWKRARADYARAAGGDRLSAGARWRPDRCAGLDRTLRGSDLAAGTAEEAYVLIHTHARHC
jgi:hypothetical protein